MTLRGPGRRLLGRAGVVAALGLFTAAALAQTPTPPPPGVHAFPVAVELVGVDVVVTNRKGDPVSGLTKKDFSVLEDGREQEVVSFDVAQRVSGAGTDPAADLAYRPVATNTASVAASGRSFVIVFDSIHLSPLGGRTAKAAVAAFLEKGTRPTDNVLLIGTGENFWWNARAGSGHADLLSVLKGFEGRRFPEGAGERLTDYEAVQISVYHDVRVAARVTERFQRYGDASRRDMLQSQQTNQVGSQIDMYVDQRARDAYLQMRSRLELTLGLLERSFRALAENRERKTVILVSEGFVNDPSNRRLRAVTQAARRANAALYFIDARGLEAMSQQYGDEFGPAVEKADRLGAIADISRDGDGAEAVAAETGGFTVRNTRDFATDILRIGQESENYYLLGYVPPLRGPDDRFHKVEVRVRGGKGLVVRAREGYYDAVPAPEQGAEPGPGIPADLTRRERSDPALQHAVDSPGLLDALPLRMSTYALQPALADKALVVVAADMDISKVSFDAVNGNAVLDTLLIVAAQNGGVERADRKVELQRRVTPPFGGPAWYSFARDFMLPSGRYQAKLIVRDTATGNIGTLTQTFDVPPLDALRMATPVLSDTLQKNAAGASVPALLARRAFRRDAQLFCQFDVFGAAKGPDGLPRVKAGHELRRRGGAAVGRTEPTQLVPTSIGALTRLIQIPLSITTPGEYDLVLRVTDEISGQRLERVEPFTVTPTPGG